MDKSMHMFYLLDEQSQLLLDEHQLPIPSNRPETKSLADLLCVVQLHSANQDKHWIVGQFARLYGLGLQWDWFEAHQAWLARKLDFDAAEPQPLPELLEPEPVLVEWSPPEFSEPEPQRPPLLEPAELLASVAVDGVALDELMFRLYRASAVASIVVEVDGLAFDGDEESQRRMASAIQAAQDTGLSQTLWRLADNTQQAITLEQLKAAHAAAIVKQGELWMRPSGL